MYKLQLKWILVQSSAYIQPLSEGNIGSKESPTKQIKEIPLNKAQQPSKSRQGSYSSF